MKTFFITLLLFAAALLPAEALAPYGALPSPATLKWHQNECFAIVHYGLNTYEGKEWGYGNADPRIFNPSHLDTDQWCRIAKAAGLKGMILVAKHHDGFCLWPTKTTPYNISAAPWKNGKGNLVDDFVRSCQKYGLQPGLYVSPWDRNNPHYGTEAYVRLYHDQWKELMSAYGNAVFEVWFDGANGGDGYYGGACEVRTIPKDYYQFDALFREILGYAPDAVFFGGNHRQSSRWVGNESGVGGCTNWCTYRPESNHYGLSEQQILPTGIFGADTWVPAEADVPLYTPKRWFFDERVKPHPLPELMDIYYQTVGRNCALNIGLAPTKDGLLSPQDEASLLKWRAQIEKESATDCAAAASFSASAFREADSEAACKQALTDRALNTYWATPDGVQQATLTLHFNEPTAINRLMLQENIALGQRVKAFSLTGVDAAASEKLLARGTTIGYKRILRFPSATVTDLRLTLQTDAPCLTLSTLALFYAPDLVPPPRISQTPFGKIVVQGAPNHRFFYRIDEEDFLPYRLPVRLSGSRRIEAYAVDRSGNRSDTVQFFSADAPALWTRIRKDDHTLVFSRIRPVPLTGFFYLPKQSPLRKGLALQYEIDSSTDGKKWVPIQKGDFANIVHNPTLQQIYFDAPVVTRWIRLLIPKTDNAAFEYEQVGFYCR